MWRKPARRSGSCAFHAPAPEAHAGTKSDNSGCRGWTLLELMVAVMILGLLFAIAVPRIQTTILNYRLGAAASSVAAAIQQTRYQAIVRGCYYTIAFTAGSTTYQVQTQDLTTGTPACVTNADGSAKFTSSGSVPASWTIAPVSWATTGGGISVTSSPTLEFAPSGIAGLPPSPATNPLSPCTVSTSGCSFQLSNGNATRTISISGVGSVKVTSP